MPNPTFEMRNHTRRKPKLYTDKKQKELIQRNSEKRIMESIEHIQTQLDEVNGALMNIRIFFYHYKHASEPKPLYTGKRKVVTK